MLRSENRTDPVNFPSYLKDPTIIHYFMETNTLSNKQRFTKTNDDFLFPWPLLQILPQHSF